MPSRAERVTPVETLPILEDEEIQKYITIISNGQLLKPDSGIAINLEIPTARVEFTGLPKLGKSTITQEISRQLIEMGFDNDYIEERPVDFGKKPEISSDWDMYMFNLAMFHGGAYELIQLYWNTDRPDITLFDRCILGQISFSATYSDIYGGYHPQYSRYVNPFINAHRYLIDGLIICTASPDTCIRNGSRFDASFLSSLGTQYANLKEVLAEFEKEIIDNKSINPNPKFPYGNPLIVAEIDYDEFDSDEKYEDALNRTLFTIINWRSKGKIAY